MKKRFLVDSNIIIGAERGSSQCAAVLSAGAIGKAELLATGEIIKECGRLPIGVLRYQPPATTPVRDYSAFTSYLTKEFGGPDGTRVPASKADRELLATARGDRSICGIVSDDSDLRHLWAELPLNERMVIKIFDSATARRQLAQ